MKGLGRSLDQPKSYFGAVWPMFVFGNVEIQYYPDSHNYIIRTIFLMRYFFSGKKICNLSWKGPKSEET